MKGPGTIPSFDESKDSQNRKRVKKCFEELKVFVFSKTCWVLREAAGATVIIFQICR